MPLAQPYAAPVTEGVEREWARRRQLFGRRVVVVAFPVLLLGVGVEYGLQQGWGRLLFLAGMLIYVLGFAAAPLLYPKPLGEK